MSTDSIDSRGDAIKLRRKLRVGLYVFSWLFFLVGAFLNAQGDARVAATLCELTWACCLVLWCREDAIIANRPLPTLSLWVVLLFWPIAVPVCVIRIKGALYGSLLVVLHFVIYVMAYAIPAAVLFMQQA
jgi:hypothetical protein